MKSCLRCKEKKSKNDFNVNIVQKDGLHYYCKDCVSLYNKKRYKKKIDEIKKARLEYYYKNKEKSLLMNKEWRHSNREKYNGYQDKYVKSNPDKRRAHVKVRLALEAGRLVKNNCEVCSNPEVHAHHEDYSNPLDVIWLCPQCHSNRHKEKRYATA